jgi:nicotinamidase-related amidase
MSPAQDPQHALIVIDVQQGFDDPAWGRRDNPDCEANIARLIAAWRAADRRRTP